MANYEEPRYSESDGYRSSRSNRSARSSRDVNAGAGYSSAQNAQDSAARYSRANYSSARLNGFGSDASASSASSASGVSGASASGRGGRMTIDARDELNPLGYQVSNVRQRRSAAASDTGSDHAAGSDRADGYNRAAGSDRVAGSDRAAASGRAASARSQYDRSQYSSSQRSARGETTRRSASSRTNRAAGADRAERTTRGERGGRSNAITPRGNNAVATRNSNSVTSRGNNAASQYSRRNSAYSASSATTAKKPVGKIVAIVIAVLLLAGVVWGISYVSKIFGNVNSGVTDGAKAQLTPTKYDSEPSYILLMGTDKDSLRENDPEYGGSFRSDSMMLCRVDPVNKKISLISLLRDTMVDMGEYGTQKLNSAYTLGGAELTIKTVSQMTGLPISHYAEINFEGFAAIVNSLGGIEVDVPMDMDDPDSDCHLKKGTQTLDGWQALSLCRNRHSYDEIGGGDIYRAANQRMVLSAIVGKALSSDILTIANTVTTASEYISTDMQLSDVIGLAQLLKGIDIHEDIYTASEPTTSQLIDDLWYEVLNTDEWNKMITRLDQGLPPAEVSEVDQYGTVLSNSGTLTVSDDTWQKAEAGSLSGDVAVRNGTETSGLASSAANDIKAMGFETDAGNANEMNYTQTLIVLNDGATADYAAAIAKKLGCGTVMPNDGQYSLSHEYLVILGKDYSDLVEQQKAESSNSSSNTNSSNGSGNSSN